MSQSAGGTGLPERGAILRAAAGIAVYVLGFGISFGAVSVGSGLDLAQTMVLSVVLFSGASQFAFVGVAAVAPSPLAAVPTALLLGVRNAFYGVPIATLLRPRGVARVWTAQLVIDETTGMAISQPTPRAGRYAFWATALSLYPMWVLGTLIGALLGQAIDPKAFGLDAAGPAVFLGLLWPMLGTARARGLAVLGALVAVALVPLVPAGVPVLAAAGVALLAGLLPASHTSAEPT